MTKAATKAASQTATQRADPQPQNGSNSAAILAGGIDLGGTKIEAQVFGADWQIAARQRWTTPKDYAGLIAAMAKAVAWCDAQAGAVVLPIGISAAGRINPATGLALTANLAASGQPFARDVAQVAGRGVVWLNDCQALAQSEARFGAAKGRDPAMMLIFGTGVSGAVITGGAPLPAFAGLGGEFGHFALPAGPIAAHGLPILPCGCGRTGCAETLLCAQGLARIAQHVTGQAFDPKDIISGRARDPAFAKAWEIWLDLATEFLIALCFTLDPAVIVLGGGLSNTPHIVQDLTARLSAATLHGFAIPPIVLASGGDTSGARGAAYAAFAAFDRAADVKVGQ